MQTFSSYIFTFIQKIQYTGSSYIVRCYNAFYSVKNPQKTLKFSIKFRKELYTLPLEDMDLGIFKEISKIPEIILAIIAPQVLKSLGMVNSGDGQNC